MTKYQIEITDISSSAAGVGHLNENSYIIDEGKKAMTSEDKDFGMTVFVADCLPGDIIICQIVKRRKRYLEGKCLEILQGSNRRKSPWPGAEKYDACPLLLLKKDKQEEWKKKHLLESLIRLGGLVNDQIPEIHFHSSKEEGYRNKVNLRINNQGLLSFSDRSSNNLIAAQDCFFAADPIREAVKSWNSRLKSDRSLIKLTKKMKMLVLRSNEDNELMMIVICQSLSEDEKNAIFKNFAFIGAQVFCISENPNKNDVRIGKKLHFYSDKKALDMKLADLKLKLSPASFFQVNRYETLNLYNTAISMLDKTENEDILDLYCGTGTTSLMLARKFRSVLAIEIEKAAVRDAIENAKINHINNVKFLAGKAEDLILDLEDRGELAENILVDPPRKGLDQKVRQAIIKSKAKRLIYISCNPASLARDLSDFMGGGFKIEKMHAFDFFPNSLHVEALTLLSRD